MQHSSTASAYWDRLWPRVEGGEYSSSRREANTTSIRLAAKNRAHRPGKAAYVYALRERERESGVVGLQRGEKERDRGRPPLRNTCACRDNAYRTVGSKRVRDSRIPTCSSCIRPRHETERERERERAWRSQRRKQRRAAARNRKDPSAYSVRSPPSPLLPPSYPRIGALTRETVARFGAAVGDDDVARERARAHRTKCVCVLLCVCACRISTP